MNLLFHKYQGTGNDFIMIDNRLSNIALEATQVQHLCDRRFGIGADGIILLEPHQEADFSMIYYNADGTQSFCGNGSRCVVRFAQHLGLVNGEASYEAIDGIHRSEILNDGRIATHMHDVSAVEEIGDDLFIHTGSPHYIRFVDNLDHLAIVSDAHKIRYSEPYRQNGTNVNFVAYDSEKIKVRTYERGVEGETLSCGTGVTAVAIAHCYKNKLLGEQDIPVHAAGGVLNIRLRAGNNGYDHIQLIGPAEKVYEGEVTL